MWCSPFCAIKSWQIGNAKALFCSQIGTVLCPMPSDGLLFLLSDRHSSMPNARWRVIPGDRAALGGRRGEDQPGRGVGTQGRHPHVDRQLWGGVVAAARRPHQRNGAYIVNVHRNTLIHNWSLLCLQWPKPRLIPTPMELGLMIVLGSNYSGPLVLYTFYRSLSLSRSQCRAM